MFYLRPRFYKYLPPSERPEGWEQYAEQDEMKWKQEDSKKSTKKSSVEDSLDGNKAREKTDSNETMSATADVEDDGEETEDEG